MLFVFDTKTVCSHEIDGQYHVLCVVQRDDPESGRRSHHHRNADVHDVKRRSNRHPAITKKWGGGGDKKTRHAVCIVTRIYNYKL